MANTNEEELSLVNFEKALSFDFPKTTEFYEDIGAAYAISGQYEKAVQYLLKAVELDTGDPATYTNLGIIYQQLGDIDSASLYMTKGDEMREKMESKK